MLVTASQDLLPGIKFHAMGLSMNLSRYFGILILTVFPLATSQGGEDKATGAGQPGPSEAQLEQLVQSSPGQVVQSLPGQITQSLPGQMVQPLPGQMVPWLPGQVVHALPGQIVPSLPGQVVHSLTGQVVQSLPDKKRIRLSVH
jgi:hypothetical protein